MSQIAVCELTAAGTAIGGRCSMLEHAGISIDESKHFQAYEVTTRTSIGDSTGSGHMNARRVAHPITILKEVDEATPPMLQALDENQIVEGKIYLVNTEQTQDGQGSGATVVNLELEIKGGRFVDHHMVDTDTLDPHRGNLPAREVWHLSYYELTYNHPGKSKTYTTKWGVSK